MEVYYMPHCPLETVLLLVSMRPVGHAQSEADTYVPSALYVSTSGVLD